MDRLATFKCNLEGGEEISLQLPETLYHEHRLFFTRLVGATIKGTTYNPSRETKKEYWKEAVAKGETEAGFTAWLKRD